MCAFMSRSSLVQCSGSAPLPLVPFSVLLLLLQVLAWYSLLFSILTKDEGRVSHGSLHSVWSLNLMMCWESWLWLSFHS